MKILNLLWILSLSLFTFVACDDDDNVTPEPNTGVVPQVAVSFDKEEVTVLKNAGEVQIPIVLAEEAEGNVRMTVAVKQQTNNTAEEGIDFDIKEKVITIEKGNKIGYVTLTLHDDSKTNADKSFALEIKNVYGYGKAGESKQNCTVRIVSNAFAEFQYANRETYEAAGTYQIPVIIQGEIKNTTTLTVRVKEGGTALEGTHFTIANSQITCEPGTTTANIEVNLVDDTEANADRWFDLEITQIEGSNAIIGSQKICRLTIISEEVFKSVFFSAEKYNVKEGQNLQIPVRLDKAPATGESDVEVTFSVKVANSTAIEGEDFIIEEKTLYFVPGQMENDLVIKTLDNDLIDEDKTIEISFRAAIGANIGTPAICEVTIENEDLPAFKQTAYEIEEALGDFVLPVELPAIQPSDAHLIIKVVAGEAAKEGKHFTLTTPEVVIPAGETKGEVHVNIGHDLEWTSTPEFKVYVEEINGVLFEENICSATISLIQSTYRKLIGTWTIQATNDQGANVTYKTEFSGGTTTEEQDQNFGKKIRCTNFTNFSAWNVWLEFIDGKLYYATDKTGTYDGQNMFPAYITSSWEFMTRGLIEIIIESDTRLSCATRIGCMKENKANVYNGQKNMVWTKE